MDTLPPEEREKYKRELKSEERRAVIWLGILAVVVAFDVYLRDDRPPDVFNKAFYYNFFCNSPCSHITFYWVPFLDSLIYFWIGYAIFALVYFSEDLLPGKRGTRTRKSSRRIGHILLAFLPLLTGIYLVLGIASVTLPDYLQTPTVFAVSYVVAQFLIWGFERITGKKIFGKQSILNKPTDAFLKVAREGTQIILEAFIHAWRKILEKLLKHRTTGPLRTRRAFLILFSVIELVILPIGYFVEHLSPLSGLAYLFAAPFYILLIIAPIVGWYYRRNRKVKNSNQSDPVASIPEP
jgi:hypothetical protein